MRRLVPVSPQTRMIMAGSNRGSLRVERGGLRVELDAGYTFSYRVLVGSSPFCVWAPYPSD